MSDATLSNSVRLDPAQRGVETLKVLGDRVSTLWNATNYVCRQRFLAGERVPSTYDLGELMIGTEAYKRLPSDIAQETIKKLGEAWKSFRALRAKWKEDPRTNQKPGLPKYRKDRRTGERPFDLIPLKSGRGYAIHSRTIDIVLPKDRRRKPGDRLEIDYRGRDRHKGTMGRAEISHDGLRRRWYFRWTVQTKRTMKESGLSAAVDLGVRITASLSIEGRAQALHFCGRDLLHDWDWHGREIAAEQGFIAPTRGKGDAKHPPFSRAISMLHARRKTRLRHGIVCLAKEIADECDRAGVTTVFVGWPKGITREVDFGSKWNGRISGFWSFALSISILENALHALGIAAVKVGERGSSSTCPTCHGKSVIRHPRWLLRCKDCSERIHSDQAGSRNILFMNKPSVCWDGLEASPRTETLRWTTHLWQVRSSNPRQETVRSVAA